MIDLRLLRDEPELVRASQRVRGADPSLVDTLLAADAARRTAVSRADDLRAEQKPLGRLVAKATPEDRPALLARAKELADGVKAAEAEQSAADEALRAAHLAIPNVVQDGVPPGGEADFVTLELVGTPPVVENPKEHTEIGALLGAIDTERGAKVSGARFYFLTGIGAQLELALVNMAMAQATAAGFIPMIAPALVKPETMEGTGFLGAHSDEVYRLADDDLYLVGTSEVALAGYHSGEILDAAALPLRYAGFSSCFRREAGSYGKDTKGIIRVHWFDKVEMFSYIGVEEAAEEHQRLLAWEREFMDALELSYRVIDVAAGDLGSSASRKFDIEAWFPSQGAYRELTSTSNCTTFQSRRLNIRSRAAATDGGKGVVGPVATLNGTLCAVARTIACLLDHHQQPDGSVYVPAALRPWLGGRDLLTPVAR
ncbi:seryl-tRNA synthetase [Jatrophihabitans sp. GAS493]|uniref:serine--tRNA ligase n=1 Tax=Jatrophihabitans sp. GAS493 TaxID=1907575 RepID=UPI000BB849A7|nr:serine--tRNA ligase [Jatrophihabitans sp. GAS493]SOD71079.1 seryl-tRNA synthetase [Jatrophihabitans sp. GAS493]